MGAEYFEEYVPITDAEQAFNDVRLRALWEHGHGGYTGSIGEKGEFETRHSKPLLLNEAREFAEQDNLLHEHSKWGPAWHVPVKDGADQIIGHLFYGWASS